MSLKIYSEQNPNLWKALIAAKYTQVEISASNENAPESLSSKGPVLETKEGILSEANAIARYVARLGKNNIFGSNAFETALVEQWIDFSVHEIELPAAVWILPIQGKIPNNPEATSRAQNDILNVLGTLNKHLLKNPYLVGHRISLADIIVSMSLFHLYELVLDPAFSKKFQNTNRWFKTLINQPQFLAVLGEVKLCEKMQVAGQYVPKEEKKPEKKTEKKEERKPKEEKKKEEKPKEEKKKKKDDEEEKEETFEDEPKKGKNPLDDLPPSQFNLDEWKRVYSNEDTLTKAIPWFWEHVDLQGFSLWLCEYKYNEENNKLFMTCNLVGGWFQRLEKLRKYGFGSVLIFGDEPRLEISGVWLFRGSEAPEEMTASDDYTNYEWKKIDINDPAQKQLVNDYWAWEGSFGSGRKFNQGKVYK